MEYMLWWHWCVLALPILPNLWAIWHVRSRHFATLQEKNLWFALAIFVPVLGGLVYVCLGIRRSSREPFVETAGSLDNEKSDISNI